MRSPPNRASTTTSFASPTSVLLNWLPPGSRFRTDLDYHVQFAHYKVVGLPQSWPPPQLAPKSQFSVIAVTNRNCKFALGLPLELTYFALSCTHAVSY